MTNLRKAAEMALEALENAYSFIPLTMGSIEQNRKAVEALRQALLQPEWVGLTDDERQEIVKQEVHWSGICRSIEAKLKEKNNG